METASDSECQPRPDTAERFTHSLTGISQGYDEIGISPISWMRGEKLTLKCLLCFNHYENAKLPLYKEIILNFGEGDRCKQLIIEQMRMI